MFCLSDLDRSEAARLNYVGPGEVSVSAPSAECWYRKVIGRGFSALPPWFDEPLAPALPIGLDYAHPPCNITAMLPNATPGPRRKPFKNPVPSQHMATDLGDRVSERLMRIQRETQKVRPPRLGPPSDVAGSVPCTRSEGNSGASVTTPTPSDIPLDDKADNFMALVECRG